MTPYTPLQADNTNQELKSIDKLMSGSNLVQNASSSLLNDSISPVTAVINTSVAINNLANLDQALSVNISTTATWSKSLQEHSSATGDAFTNFTSKASSSINNLIQSGADLTTLIVNIKTLQSLNMAANIGKTGAAISGATTATRLLGVATKAIPWLAAIGAVLSLGEAIYTLVVNTDGAVQANKRLKASIEDLEKDTANEEIILNQLFKSLRNAEEGSERWLAIRETINQKYGSQLQQMQLEIKNTDDSTKAYRRLSDAIKEAARQKAQEKAISTAKNNYVNAEAEPLQDIYDNLTKKHGKEKGVDYYVQIRDAIRRGETFSTEIQNIINGFQSQVSGREATGERTPVYSNPVLQQIQQLQKQNKALNTEIDNIYHTYDKLKQAEESNNKRHESTTLQQYNIRQKTQAELKDYISNFQFKQPVPSPLVPPNLSPDNSKPSILFPVFNAGWKATRPAAPGQAETDTTVSPPLPLSAKPNAQNPIGKAINTTPIPRDPFAGNAKTINVSINNLIDKFEISTANLQESTDRMRDLVTNVLISAVNDLNTIA